MEFPLTPFPPLPQGRGGLNREEASLAGRGESRNPVVTISPRSVTRSAPYGIATSGSSSLGQTVSLVGSWMQTVALGWLVYRLTHSPLLLGLTGFLGQIPSLFFSPLAGVWADRWNRHRMVIWAQVAAMVQALALAALVLSGHATIAAVLALSLALGFITAVDIPARQSFFVDLVGPDDLPNAIALNSSIFNVARLVGPSIAGVMIGLVGEGMVFLLNGVSYLAVLASLLAIRVPPAPARPGEPPHVLAHLAEGLRYAGRFRTIRALLLLLALTSLVGAPYGVLLPMFATDVLGGGAHTLGFLVGAVGLGALAGALFLAARRGIRGLGRVVAGSAVLFGASLVALGLARTPWLALVALAFSGFGLMTQMAATNTLLQTLSDPDKRGRVVSLYTASCMGMAPLGALMAGALAGRIGAPVTVLAGGALCVVAAALFARELPRSARRGAPHLHAPGPSSRRWRRASVRATSRPQRGGWRAAVERRNRRRSAGRARPASARRIYPGAGPSRYESRERTGGARDVVAVEPLSIAHEGLRPDHLLDGHQRHQRHRVPMTRAARA